MLLTEEDEERFLEEAKQYKSDGAVLRDILATLHEIRDLLKAVTRVQE